MYSFNEKQRNIYILLLVSVSTQQLSTSHSQLTVYNEFIGRNSKTMSYMFLLIKPASGSIQWRIFLNYWIALYIWMYILQYNNYYYMHLIFYSLNIFKLVSVLVYVLYKSALHKIGMKVLYSNRYLYIYTFLLTLKVIKCIALLHCIKIFRQWIKTLFVIFMALVVSKHRYIYTTLFRLVSISLIVAL
jgi:hypothetical protein